MDDRRTEGITLIDEIVTDAGWNRLSEGVAARPGFDPQAETAGSLVFDVDGVLIDTHHSFREVIPEAVNCYLESALGLIGSVRRMRVEDGELIAKAGGFNNDWDVAEAGLILALWHYRQPATAPALTDLTDRIAAEGGGLDNLNNVLRSEAGEIGAREILEDVDRTLLERIFKELYMGETVYREIYSTETRFHEGEGAMSRERPTVEGPIWEAVLSCPYGIFTGRIPEEMQLAAELLGIPERPGDENVVSDDGRFPAKPAPDGLIHLAGHLPARPLCYFGDNRDDLTALLNAREQLGADDLHFICCLTGASDSESVHWFAAAGAAMIAIGLEEALQVLIPAT
ncbi:HAD family hydrolase [Gemmatimonadota bacterium]